MKTFIFLFFASFFLSKSLGMFFYFCWSSHISIVTHVQTMHIIVLKIVSSIILWGAYKKAGIWNCALAHWHQHSKDVCRAHFVSRSDDSSYAICNFNNAPSSSDLDSFHLLYEFHSLKWISVRQNRTWLPSWNEHVPFGTVWIKFTWMKPIEPKATWKSAETLRQREERKKNRCLCYVNAMLISFNSKMSFCGFVCACVSLFLMYASACEWNMFVFRHIHEAVFFFSRSVSNTHTQTHTFFFCRSFDRSTLLNYENLYACAIAYEMKLYFTK